MNRRRTGLLWTALAAGAASLGWTLLAVSMACDIDEAKLDGKRIREVARLREAWRKAEESRSRARLAAAP